MKNRLKIAVWHNLPSGGGKRALFDHVRGLIQRGHHVEAWCPSIANQTYLPLNTLVPEHILPLSWSIEPIPNLAGKIRRGRWNVYRKSMLMRAHAQQCAHQINEGGFDVLLAASCLLFNSPHIGRYINIPKILYLQEPGRFLYEAMPNWPWLPVAFPQKFKDIPGYIAHFCADMIKIRLMRHQASEEQKNARSFDRLLVNSYFSRESILRAYGLDSTVCYLGVDTDMFTDRKMFRQRIFVGVGAIIPAKNIEFVIRSLAKIESAYDGLIWIGNRCDDHYLQTLQLLASSLGVKFDTKLLVSDDELVKIMNTAYAMIYTPHLEPFGYAPIEANACGLPVIGIAEGGVRETVINNHNGLLVNNNIDDLKQTINRLLSQPELVKQLSANGRKYVEDNWSLSKMIDRLEDQLLTTSNGSKK